MVPYSMLQCFHELTQLVLRGHRGGVVLRPSGIPAPVQSDGGLVDVDADGGLVHHDASHVAVHAGVVRPTVGGDVVGGGRGGGHGRVGHVGGGDHDGAGGNHLGVARGWGSDLGQHLLPHHLLAHHASSGAHHVTLPRVHHAGVRLAGPLVRRGGLLELRLAELVDLLLLQVDRVGRPVPVLHHLLVHVVGSGPRLHPHGAPRSHRLLISLSHHALIHSTRHHVGVGLPHVWLAHIRSLLLQL